MGLQDYFKEYMSRYRGIDAYKDGYEDTQFGQWNYEDGCLLLGVKMMYQAVSYTHLNTLQCLASQALDNENMQLYSSCLLYTSRCV